MRTIGLSDDRWRQLREIAAIRGLPQAGVLGELIGKEADRLSTWTVCYIAHAKPIEPITVDLLGELHLEIIPAEAILLARGLRRMIEQGGDFCETVGDGKDAKTIRIARRGPTIEFASGASYVRKIVSDVAVEIADKLERVAFAAQPSLRSA